MSMEPATVTALQANRDECVQRLSLDDLTGDTASVEQAAQVLGISRGLGYELARRGELPGVLHLGRRMRVSVRALRAALGAHS